MIRYEFLTLWKTQKGFKSKLSELLTDDVRLMLDNPQSNHVWRNQGLLFGQRKTWWNIGTLGRCVLEPTDQCVPHADRHASYYRVLEYVNRIRVQGPAILRNVPSTPNNAALFWNDFGRRRAQTQKQFARRFVWIKHRSKKSAISRATTG